MDKKKVSFGIFSIIKTTYGENFSAVKITDKVLSLSKFRRYLVSVKIVKMRFFVKMFTMMLLYMYQIFSSLQDHLHF